MLMWTAVCMSRHIGWWSLYTGRSPQSLSLSRLGKRQLSVVYFPPRCVEFVVYVKNLRIRLKSLLPFDNTMSTLGDVGIEADSIPGKDCGSQCGSFFNLRYANTFMTDIRKNLCPKRAF